MSVDRPPSTAGAGRRRLPWLVGGTAAAVLVGLTAAVLVADGPLPGEVAIIRALQGLGQPVPAFADVVRATTGTEGNLVVGALPATWLVRRLGRDGLAAVLICLVAMLVVQPVAKELVDRDRPSAAEVEVRAEHSSRSYPSGHSLSTTTVWGAAALFTARLGQRRLAALLVVPVCSTAVASGIHGVHWASDAIAGTIMGGAAAWLAIEQVQPRSQAAVRPLGKGGRPGAGHRGGP